MKSNIPSQVTSAFEVIGDSIPPNPDPNRAMYGLGEIPLILEAAVCAIVEAAPCKGLTSLAPDAVPLAHLIRVLMKANDTCWPCAGFFHGQLLRLESLMREHPGDRARACLNLGYVFAQALEIMDKTDIEKLELNVPDIFRLNKIESA